MKNPVRIRIARIKGLAGIVGELWITPEFEWVLENLGVFKGI